jgi:hypothetical protein
VKISLRELPVKNVRGIVIIAIVLFALGSTACADTIFSNLGSGSTYALLSGNGNLFHNRELAMPFTVAAGSGFNLTQLDIGVTSFEFPNSPIIELRANSGGLPGTIIQSWTLTNVPHYGSSGLVQPSQTISGITGILLSGGTQYWLAANAANGNFLWNYTAPYQVGSQAYSGNGGGTWNPSLTYIGAFDVQGTPASAVPEPSAMLLLATGLLSMVVLATFKRSIV